MEREALLRVERARGIALRFLAEDLGFDGNAQNSIAKTGSAKTLSAQAPELSFEITPAELSMIANRRYWTVKRAIDCLGGIVLLVLCAPLMMIAAISVAASVGLPVFFWQQRPGLGGRPIRLYKVPHHETAPWRRWPPAFQRGTRLANRRPSCAGCASTSCRNLFSIARGDMSFIGPRPLLPCDQSDAYRARLLVRPGLTGWAQVVGGRDISPEDKAALDIWYVRNASLALDLEIAARTIPMVLLGERITWPLIERAWRELSEGGILKGDLAYKSETVCK